MKFSTLLLFVFFAPGSVFAGDVVVKPFEIDDVLVNPGMGWQTFHSYIDDLLMSKY
jgi:hypothetical protein